MNWDLSFSQSDVAAAARAFIARRRLTVGPFCSESLLGGEAGAWVLRFGNFSHHVGEGAVPIPLAAILDASPSVVFVTALQPDDAASKEVREHVWGSANLVGKRVVMLDEVLIELGARERADSLESWYSRLKTQWQPVYPRLLVLAGALPDPRGPGHPFYAEPLMPGDGLFRAVVEGVCEASPGRVGDPKRPWLENLAAEGVAVAYLVGEPLLPLGDLSMVASHAAEEYRSGSSRIDPEAVVLADRVAAEAWPDPDFGAVPFEPTASGPTGRPRFGGVVLGGTSTAAGRRALAATIARALGPSP